MSETQSLECRIYMIESDLYLAQSELQRLLHELEHELTSLADDVHHELCESGRIHGEQKARDIVARTRATLSAIDLAPIEATADQVAGLEARIEECEQRISSLGQERHLHAVA